MAYFHGVHTSEQATSVLAPVQVAAGLPVIIGTAPVHLAEDGAVNTPVICYSYQEAVSQLGYSKDWASYTLCEAIYSEFQLYAVSPVIFINVLDPAKHKTAVTDSTGHSVSKEKTVTLTDPVILSTLQVKPSAGGAAATAETDYVAAYDDDGNCVITILEDGTLGEAETVYCDYDKVDPSAVTSDDIIGGVGSDGNTTGLELINNVYPMLAQVPGLLLAPGWSEDQEVMAVMVAKASNINGLFKCLVLTDINTAQVKKYADVNMWKNGNNYTGTDQVVCWPMVRQGDDIYHLSTALAGVIGVTDSNNSDVPYKSPSNERLQATGLCLTDGTEVVLGLEQANLLNSQGICTGLNFNGGWKTWGNFTGCYPSNTDVKDMYIAVRRMFNWDAATFILTMWQMVDKPLTKRFVQTIVDTEQIRLNGLVSRGFLLGARVEYREDENPVTDMLNGIFRIHKYFTPPVPAQEIEEIAEYDVDNLQSLFETA